MSADFITLTETNGNVVNMRLDTVRAIRTCTDDDCPDKGSVLVLYDWLELDTPEGKPRRAVPVILQLHCLQSPLDKAQEPLMGMMPAQAIPIPDGPHGHSHPAILECAWCNARIDTPGTIYSVVRGQNLCVPCGAQATARD